MTSDNRKRRVFQPRNFTLASKFQNVASIFKKVASIFKIPASISKKVASIFKIKASKSNAYLQSDQFCHLKPKKKYRTM